MRKSALAVALATVLTLPACTRHLLFVEEDHIGLRAKFEGESPTPAEVHLGYRRGLMAFIPQQESHLQNGEQSGSVSVDTSGPTKRITINKDPRELMSLYTVFKANVGFLDPVEFHHFVATGAAAEQLLANHDELRHVTDHIGTFSDEASGSSSGQNDGGHQ